MKKEEFKNELKGKVLLNSFWNEKKELILLELEECETLNNDIEAFIKDLETVYNIKKIEFISMHVLEVEKQEISIFPTYKISYEITLHFDIINTTISSIKTEKINFYVYKDFIKFIE